MKTSGALNRSERHTEQPRRLTFRAVGVVILVLVVHLLLVSVLLRSGSRDAHKRTEPTTVLVLLNLEALSEQTPEKARAARLRRPRESSGAAASEPSGESTSISPGAAPSTDWQRELEITVEKIGPEVIKEYMRRCAQAERTHAPRPSGCPRRSYDGPWRLSGNLLQDMRDPDRPRSSVPDLLPDAFAKAPRSPVFQNDHSSRRISLARR